MKTSMHLIRVRYRGGADFLQHYQETFPDGGVFYPTRRALDVGTQIALEIRFPGLPNRLVLRGEVAWRRAGRHSLGLRAGLGIAFVAQDAPRRDCLLRVARGQQDGLTHRRFRRFPVNAVAGWRSKETAASSSGIVADIGPGGAYIRDTSSSPQTGSDVVLTLLPPGSLAPLDVEGRVIWVRKEDALNGFGVEFKIRDVGGLRRIKEVVRRLEADALVA